MAAIYYKEFLDDCKDPKKAAKAGSDCVLAGTVRDRLNDLKKRPGVKVKPAAFEPAVAKATATAAPADTTGKD